MGMTVMYNAGAQMSLGELNKNINKLGKTLAKISSGQKIVSAQDDGSSYSISERMREQIRSLFQDDQNVQNGSSMLKTAERGVDQILDNLRTMKELAIDAANDSNTDEDRHTIQKELDQRREIINDIAIGTQYNGKILLDGRWSKSITPGGITIPRGDYTIESDGVYTLAADYSGTITINAKNVKINQANPSIPLKNVFIIGNENGTNLWIDKLNVSNSQDKNFIKFQGEGNRLNIKGKNKFNDDMSGTMRNSAIVNIGDGLIVSGNSDKKAQFNFTSTYVNLNHAGAFIGSDRDQNLSDSEIKIYGVNFISSACRLAAPLIGAGYDNGKVGNVYIKGGSFFDDYDNNYQDALIGGSGETGDIVIRDTSLIMKSNNSQECIVGANNQNGQVGNISISNSRITYRGNNGAAIGTSGWPLGNSKGGNIIVRNCVLDVQTNAVQVGSGRGGKVGYINSDIYSSNTIINSGGVVNKDADIGTRWDGLADMDPIEPLPYDSIEDSFTAFSPLWIQHGTQSGQHTNFYIGDMRSKALGIDEAEVVTKEKANEAIGIIEDAIEVALDEATNLGAYLQRLETTNANITTINENVQASESTIRDADMAKEMTEYAKYNLLTQSAQSMLAQANQNGSAVLGLLQ